MKVQNMHFQNWFPFLSLFCKAFLRKSQFLDKKNILKNFCWTFSRDDLFSVLLHVFQRAACESAEQVR